MSDIWIYRGAAVLKKKRLSVLTFRRFFKLPPKLVEKVFNLIQSHYSCQPKHLLWTLFYLKSSDSDDNYIALSLRCDIQTLRKHVYETLDRLIEILPKVFIRLTSLIRHMIILFITLLEPLHSCFVDFFQFFF